MHAASRTFTLVAGVTIAVMQRDRARGQASQRASGSSRPAAGFGLSRRRYATADKRGRRS